MLGSVFSALNLPTPDEDREYPSEDAPVILLHGILNILTWNIVLPITVTCAVFMKFYGLPSQAENKIKANPLVEAIFFL